MLIPISEQEKDNFFNMMVNSPIPFDSNLNERYQGFFRIINLELDKGSFKKWFVDFFNSRFKMEESLLEDDIKSLEIVLNSKELSLLKSDLGHGYFRPVLLLSLRDFQIFYRKFTGLIGVSGCVIHLPGFNLRIIISTNSPEFIYHELRHSADYYLETRGGYDKIIEEFIGFFGSVKYGKTVVQTTKSTIGGEVSVSKTQKIVKSSISSITQDLKSDNYHKQMMPSVSFNEYCEKVDEIGELIASLKKYFNLKVLDRILYHSKKIADLRNLLMIAREKGLGNS